MGQLLKQTLFSYKDRTDPEIVLDILEKSYSFEDILTNVSECILETNSEYDDVNYIDRA